MGRDRARVTKTLVPEPLGGLLARNGPGPILGLRVVHAGMLSEIRSGVPGGIDGAVYDPLGLHGSLSVDAHGNVEVPLGKRASLGGVEGGRILQLVQVVLFVIQPGVDKGVGLFSMQGPGLRGTQIVCAEGAIGCKTMRPGLKTHDLLHVVVQQLQPLLQGDVRAEIVQLLGYPPGYAVSGSGCAGQAVADNKIQNVVLKQCPVGPRVIRVLQESFDRSGHILQEVEVVAHAIRTGAGAGHICDILVVGGPFMPFAARVAALRPGGKGTLNKGLTVEPHIPLSLTLETDPALEAVLAVSDNLQPFLELGVLRAELQAQGVQVPLLGLSRKSKLYEAAVPHGRSTGDLPLERLEHDSGAVVATLLSKVLSVEMVLAVLAAKVKDIRFLPGLGIGMHSHIVAGYLLGVLPGFGQRMIFLPIRIVQHEHLGRADGQGLWGCQQHASQEEERDTEVPRIAFRGLSGE